METHHHHAGFGISSRQDRDPNLQLVYGNITQWGLAALEFVLASSAQIFCFVEHQLGWSELLRLQSSLRVVGLKVFGVAARQKNEGTSGGALFITRVHLAMLPVSLGEMAAEISPMCGRGTDWVAMRLSLCKTTLVIICFYLTDSLGATGIKRLEMSELVAFVARVEDPVAMIGDWNMTPAELASTQFAGG